MVATFFRHGWGMKVLYTPVDVSCAYCEQKVPGLSQGFESLRDLLQGGAAEGIGDFVRQVLRGDASGVGLPGGVDPHEDGDVRQFSRTSWADRHIRGRIPVSWRRDLCDLEWGTWLGRKQAAMYQGRGTLRHGDGMSGTGRYLRFRGAGILLDCCRGIRVTTFLLDTGADAEGVSGSGCVEGTRMRNGYWGRCGSSASGSE